MINIYIYILVTDWPRFGSHSLRWHPLAMWRHLSISVSTMYLFWYSSMVKKTKWN